MGGWFGTWEEPGAGRKGAVAQYAGCRERGTMCGVQGAGRLAADAPVAREKDGCPAGCAGKRAVRRGMGPESAWRGWGGRQCRVVDWDRVLGRDDRTWAGMVWPMKMRPVMRAAVARRGRLDLRARFGEERKGGLVRLGVGAAGDRAGQGTVRRCWVAKGARCGPAQRQGMTRVLGAAWRA